MYGPARLPCMRMSIPVRTRKSTWSNACLRRAVLDGHQLGLREPFLFKLVPFVVDAMKSAYPELTETTERVAA